jgi:endonuclease/exonuclease/phosphatase (EEP) superfamily protein YafD
VEAVSRGGLARRLLPVVIAVVVPWAWFAVRDIGGPFDAVAVGLPLIGVTAILSTAVVAVIAGRAWPLVAGTSILVVCSVAVIGPRLPRAVASPDPGIRVLMANVWEANPAPESVPASLFERGADVVVAAEMPKDPFYEQTTVAATAAGLTETVEHGQLAAWSRFPVRALSETGLPASRVMRIGVDAPGSPFVLYVVHAPNPLRDDTSFSDQRWFAEELLDSIALEHRPVVLAGDLNMSDRVVSYRLIDGALTDAMEAGAAAETTYVGGWWTTLLLRIDHIFVDPSWCAADPSTVTIAGSDHRGVEAAVGPCP